MTTLVCIQQDGRCSQVTGSCHSNFNLALAVEKGATIRPAFHTDCGGTLQNGTSTYLAVDLPVGLEFMAASYGVELPPAPAA